MHPYRAWVLVAAPIAAALTAATAAGVSVHAGRQHAEPVPAEPLNRCDHACAMGLARDFEQQARRDRSEHRDLVYALGGAIDRDDCDSVAEMGAALLRVRALSADEQLAISCCKDRPHLVPKPSPAPPAGAVVRLQRTGCGGPCPIYTVTVDADGVVTFDGRAFVDQPGPRSWTIGRPGAAEIFAAFERMGFWSIPPSYEPNIDDAPGVVLTLAYPGVTHTVRDEAVCETMESMRSGICYLAQRFDELARTSYAVRSD
jgi:hypothetical protein